MNIFFIDTDVQKCAQMHVDKHVTKMRVELAQLACTAHHLSGTNLKEIPYKRHTKITLAPFGQGKALITITIQCSLV